MALFAPLDTPLRAGNAKKSVNYFYDMDIGNFGYELGHPMKPHRIRLTHSLVMEDGDISKPATAEEMTAFHADDYINFLKVVTPDNMHRSTAEQTKYNIDQDTPIFDGLFEFCGVSAGGSLEGAARLGRGKCDIAINWAGGLHHAKKSESSGFCYVNDIVLAILELLKYHARVLYIDIDVHHGDGVEEAFVTTDRVMTVSFHRFGEYFPGTGEVSDIGVGNGKHYSVNFPLQGGIDDISYKAIFEPVISKIMERYRPGTVVLQCGADSLSGDRLGKFNLGTRGHANCVEFVKSFNVPTLVLGGGGYTMKNVARTWAYETGVLLDHPMDPVLPFNEYYEYYSPDFELEVKPLPTPNANSREYLRKITTSILQNLKEVDFAPSAQMIDIPPDFPGMDPEAENRLDDIDEDENKDVRYTQQRRDKMIADQDGYMSDSEDEDKYPMQLQRRNIARFRLSDSTPPESTPQIEGDAKEDTTEFAIEVEMPAENGVEAAGSKLENKIKEEMVKADMKAFVGAAKDEVRESAKIGDKNVNPSLGAEDSVRFTSEAASETSELQGDTVTVDVSIIVKNTASKGLSP